MQKTVYLILLTLFGVLSLHAKAISLEDKIGQMFILGFHGPSVNESSPIIQDIKKRNLGGVLFFHIDKHANIESPEQLKKLTQDLKAAAKTPLIIATDQEGGMVNHLKEKYGFPKTDLMHKDLGKIDKYAKTYAYSSKIAHTLKSNGINLNFAPVVDLKQEGNFIDKKGRAFSEDPEKVTKHAQAFIEGHKDMGILSTLKHFPGHGSSLGDTHEGYVDVTNTWTETELIPYSNLISQNNVEIIMVSHVFNKKIDPKYPASLSKQTINRLLRNKMGYKGIVVTDDICMGSIANNYSFKETVTQAIIAGNDWIIIGHEQCTNPNILEEAIGHVVQAIQEGHISEARIEESYKRIQQLKANLNS